MAMVAIGPTPGQHADQRTDQAAEEAEREIHRRQRGREAEPEIADEIEHRMRLNSRAATGASGIGSPSANLNRPMQNAVISAPNTSVSIQRTSSLANALITIASGPATTQPERPHRERRTPRPPRARTAAPRIDHRSRRRPVFQDGAHHEQRTEQRRAGPPALAAACRGPCRRRSRSAGRQPCQNAKAATAMITRPPTKSCRSTTGVGDDGVEWSTLIVSPGDIRSMFSMLLSEVYCTANRDASRIAPLRKPKWPHAGAIRGPPRGPFGASAWSPRGRGRRALSAQAVTAASDQGRDTSRSRVRNGGA